MKNYLIILISLISTAQLFSQSADILLNGTWYLFDGKLDELGYWDRVLTENEISDLYNP